MSDTFLMAPRSALAGATSAGGRDTAVCAAAAAGGQAGVVALIRDGIGAATVIARRGASDALAQRVRERFGIDLPAGPRRSSARGVVFAGIAPGAWLGLTERDDTGRGNDFAAELIVDLAGLASVSDQSDGYTLIRLTGASVRETLAKLVPIDIDARRFAVDDLASTVGSHIGVTLWRLPDENGAAVFEVLMFRSLARSFWHALTEAAAEYGFRG